MVELDTVRSVKDCPDGVSASPCSLTSLDDENLIYKISIALKIKIDTLINNDTADENIRDIEKLIELLSRCSPSERDFVTDISREVIIKLMEHKILN